MAPALLVAAAVCLLAAIVGAAYVPFALGTGERMRLHVRRLAMRWCAAWFALSVFLNIAHHVVRGY